MKISRRIFGIALLVAATLLFSPGTLPQKKDVYYLVYVGTYTTKQTSKGIYAYNFNAATGQLSSIGLAAESTDPSFVAVHSNGKYLYAVNEIGDFNGAKSGALSAFAIDPKSGALKLLNHAWGGALSCVAGQDGKIRARREL
jgi:6-phosphogluconolactonase